MSHRVVVFSAVFYLIFGSTVLTTAHEEHHKNGKNGHHEYLDIEGLPIIPVKIVNNTDVFVSLTIRSSCQDRIVLKPREILVVNNCFRRGIIYHVWTVFYDQQKIIEKYSFLMAAMPNNDWIFCRLQESQDSC